MTLVSLRHWGFQHNFQCSFHRSFRSSFYRVSQKNVPVSHKKGRKNGFWDPRYWLMLLLTPLPRWCFYRSFHKTSFRFQLLSFLLSMRRLWGYVYHTTYNKLYLNCNEFSWRPKAFITHSMLVVWYKRSKNMWYKRSKNMWGHVFCIGICGRLGWKYSYPMPCWQYDKIEPNIWVIIHTPLRGSNMTVIKIAM